jgi:hypothetical protein
MKVPVELTPTELAAVAGALSSRLDRLEGGMEAEASAATKVQEAIASMQDQLRQNRSAAMEDLLRRVEGSP